MDINKKITYRGWCQEKLRYSGWDVNDPHWKKQLLTDVQGMAKTWLSHGIGFQGRMSYHESYLQALNFNNRKRNKSQKRLCGPAS